MRNRHEVIDDIQKRFDLIRMVNPQNPQHQEVVRLILKSISILYEELDKARES